MSIRTDLAVEALKPFTSQLPTGTQIEERREENTLITTVTISSPEAALQMGKPMGRYITVETPPFSATTLNTEAEIEAMAQELAKLIPADGLVLVVGLGNEHITPDALGPRAIHQILATRHMAGSPAAGEFEGFRPVAAIAPGVLGQTGIETSELIASLVEDIHPAAVIVVDALASRALERLGNTIQMADCGISPGSGVQNRRKELSKNTLGVPVISMGVPTVVDGTTLAHDLLQNPGNETSEDLRQLFEPQGEQMMVTPRDIDLLVERAAKVVSMAINRALQPNLSLEDIAYLVS